MKDRKVRKREERPERLDRKKTKAEEIVPPVPPTSGTFQFADLAIPLALLLIVAAVFAQVGHFDFINHDDPIYVTQNPEVKSGLTWHGAVWSFTAGYASNWHPLTWMSHMLDVQLFGMNAGAHHLVNVLLHAINAVLLFWLLYRITGKRGRSAFVAGLFAVHPLHVQSVAWISERKDVLSTLLWLLTTFAYVEYVRRDNRKWFVLALALFLLGSMAKPMLVTLPFTLLLLDYWPLRRVSELDRAKWSRLLVEKAPFVFVSVLSSVVTFIAQRRGSAVASMALIPFGHRVANAAVSYAAYLGQMVWPVDLAIQYPYRRVISLSWILFAIGLMAASAAVVWLGRRRPYLPVGWFWYVGTLIPVIGFVQVGMQSMADRYTYIPFIGVFIMVAWSAADFAADRRLPPMALTVCGTILIGLCAWLAAKEVAYWQNSVSVWGKAAAATPGDAFAQYNLAKALAEAHREDEAFAHFSESLRLDPGEAEIHREFAVALSNAGRFDEAAKHFSETLRSTSPASDPVYVSSLRNAFAFALQKQGRFEEASREYAESLRVNPGNAETHYTFGFSLAQQGKSNEAIAQYLEALRLNPDHAGAHNDVGVALAGQGRFAEALIHFSDVVRITPNSADARNNLGSALASQGRFDEAITQFSEAIRIKPNYPEAQNNLKAVEQRKSQSR